MFIVVDDVDEIVGVAFIVIDDNDGITGAKFIVVDDRADSDIDVFEFGEFDDIRVRFD